MESTIHVKERDVEALLAEAAFVTYAIITLPFKGLGDDLRRDLI